MNGDAAARCGTLCRRGAPASRLRRDRERQQRRPRAAQHRRCTPARLKRAATTQMDGKQRKRSTFIEPLLDDTLKWTDNRLVGEVQNEVTKWVKVNQKDRKGSWKRKRSRKDEVTFRELLPDQLVLLLELLLEVKSLSSQTLHWLQKHYCLREQDAEVRHRWCELVIKHKHTVAYGDLINFLEQDQAMGVYLYGELMVNEDARQQQLVHRCFAMLQEEMDPSLQKVVAEMIF